MLLHKRSIMATKMIRQNNIAFIVFVVLVIAVLSSCSKVTDIISPQQEEQETTKDIHVYLRYSKAIVYINGKGKEVGNVDIQSLSVITVPNDARVSIIKITGESIRVSIHTRKTRTDLVPSDIYLL